MPTFSFHDASRSLILPWVSFLYIVSKKHCWHHVLAAEGRCQIAHTIPLRRSTSTISLQ